MKTEQDMIRTFQEALGDGATWNPWLERLVKVKLREWGSRMEGDRASTHHLKGGRPWRAPR